MDVDYGIQHLSGGGGAHNKENVVVEPCMSKIDVTRKGSKSMASVEESLNLPVVDIDNHENNK